MRVGCLVHASRFRRPLCRFPRKRGRSAAGFTYVEVLVAATITTLVAGISMVLTESGRRMWLVTDAKLTSLESGQTALNRLTDDLRKARQTNLACVTTATVSCPLPPCLEFDPASGQPRVGYTRNQVANTLTRTQGGATQVIAGNVLAFTPTCLPNGLVRLDVTANTQTPQS